MEIGLKNLRKMKELKCLEKKWAFRFCENIPIWLQRFIDECGEIETTKYNCEYCVNVYEKFESSLKNFFLFFYSSSQIYSIVATFLSFSSFLTNISFEFPKLLSLFGLMLSVTR